MPLDLSALAGAPRLLIEADLKPVQGRTIYPTNFPNLGAAIYRDPESGKQNLLVESAPSMANLMEAACWDGNGWRPPLDGIPYVEVEDDSGQVFTWSTLEAHRLNSVYIEKSTWFDEFAAEIGFRQNRPFDANRQLAPILLKYDPNSLVHGVMLESIAGVVRLPRALGGFIESESVETAPGSGVKFDRNQPMKIGSLTAKDNYGNVIFSRERYAPDRTTSYFNLDIRQVRSYQISDRAKHFVVLFALYKVAAVLEIGCARRRECEFDVEKVTVQGRRLPDQVCHDIGEALLDPIGLAKEATGVMEEIAEHEPQSLAPKDANGRRVTRVRYNERKKTKKGEEGGD